jgi:16S rRNA (guanine527-N7)-methyltransferase
MDSKQIDAAMKTAGVHLRPGSAAYFLAYLELLLHWNQRFNLTSLRTPKEMIERHLVESSFAAMYLPDSTRTLLDFGSGAGIPGIPIALCRPEIHVTLAESQGKKAAFLREAVRVLDLSAEVYGGRVEDLPAERLFDAVAMRAVDRMERAIPEAQRRSRHTLALLATQSSAARFETFAPDFTWEPAIGLPGADQAVLLLGERSNVPRGT